MKAIITVAIHLTKSGAYDETGIEGLGFGFK
jgi:hypothetical protein